MIETLSADEPIRRLSSFPARARELALQLQDSALWNQHRLRTVDDGPHRHVSDIWVRCLDWKTFQKDPTSFNQPHKSSWYPAADGPLRLAKQLAIDIYGAVDGEQMGGVLITRIPAGCCVLPHIDQGWHARHYEKYAISIQANSMQEFCFERKRLVTEQGDVFTFDNRYLHWVTNASPQDRITMIVCIKRPITGSPIGQPLK